MGSKCISKSTHQKTKDEKFKEFDKQTIERKAELVAWHIRPLCTIKDYYEIENN